MTYKQIEASREARLWISQVIVPVVTATIAIASIPEARTYAIDKFNKTRDSIKNRFRKD